MATTDDALETYTHLPVEVDSQTKLVSIASSDPSFQKEIASINALHSLFKTLETSNNAPPPPMPVNPKRSAQISKLRETATQNIKKGQGADAIRLLGLAIDMAASRPPWEPVGLVREEMALCYVERSNAYILLQNWAEGFKDAECSIECKKGPQTLPNGQKTPGNPNAWLFGGKALIGMSRWADAVKWLEQGLEHEDPNAEQIRDIKRLLVQAKAEVSRKA